VGRPNERKSRSDLRDVPPDVALRLLELLVRIRDEGLREPLPLALETSYRYAESRRRMSPANALARAEHTWESDRFSPERDEPEHVLAFGARAPFATLTAQDSSGADAVPDETTRFGSLARAIWDLLVTAEVLQ
jgi:exodeoxyribonuclease V gamma subunit